MIDDPCIICPRCGKSTEYYYVDWFGQGEGECGEFTELYHEWSFTPRHEDGMNRMHCEAECPFCGDRFKLDIVMHLEQFTTFKRHMNRVDFFTDEAEEELRKQNRNYSNRRFSLPSGQSSGFSLPSTSRPALPGKFSLANRRARS